MDTTTEPNPAELELTPGTPEYDAAMIAKAEGNPPAAASEDTPERPAWLPEKFATAEDMAAAYAELERRQSQPAEPTQTPPDDAAAAAVSEAGLDFDELSARYEQDGNLSEADYAALAKVGINEAMVQSYIAGQTALAEQMTSTIYATVGGEEAYTQIVSWAGDNLTSDEVEAFNRVVDSGDLSAMKLAIGGLRSRYVGAVGEEPTLLAADTATASGEVFQSTAQLTAAMRDPRYRADPAYRAEVAAKLSRSKIM